MDRLRFGMPFCCLIFLAYSVAADSRVFFTSQESVEQRLVQFIDESRSSIDMALFELRSGGLARALQRAQGRGVHLRLVLDASHREEDLPVLPAGNVRWLGGMQQSRGVMHNKFALFDQDRVVTGSYNWTPGAEYANYENALLTDDSNTVKAYAEEFETLWRRAILRPSASAPRDPKRAAVRSARKSIKIKLPIKRPKDTMKHRHKTHKRKS